MFLKILFGLIAVGLVVSSCDGWLDKRAKAEAAQKAAAQAEMAKQSARSACERERQNIIDRAKASLQAKAPRPAAGELERCAAALTGDAELQGLLKAARVSMYKTTAMDSTNSNNDRIEAIRMIGLLDAEEQQRLEPLDKKLRQAREKEQAAIAKAEAAAKRKEGVLIGMSKADVLASSWGKPRKINSTHTANGTREQWVYDGGYLYFRNGVLTTIQN